MLVLCLRSESSSCCRASHCLTCEVKDPASFGQVLTRLISIMRSGALAWFGASSLCPPGRAGSDRSCEGVSANFSSRSIPATELVTSTMHRWGSKQALGDSNQGQDAPEGIALPTPRRLSFLRRERRQSEVGAAGLTETLTTPRRMTFIGGGCVGAFPVEASERGALDDLRRASSKRGLARLLTKLRNDDYAGPQYHTCQPRSASSTEISVLSRVSLNTPRHREGDSGLSRKPAREHGAGPYDLQVGPPL